jgi:hypothetical protein
VEDEEDITGSRPLFRSLLGFGDYVMGMGCQPMGLPMFMPIFVYKYMPRIDRIRRVASM